MSNCNTNSQPSDLNFKTNLMKLFDVNRSEFCQYIVLSVLAKLILCIKTNLMKLLDMYNNMDLLCLIYGNKCLSTNNRHLSFLALNSYQLMTIINKLTDINTNRKKKLILKNSCFYELLKYLNVKSIGLIKGTVERQSPFEDLINLVSHKFKQIYEPVSHHHLEILLFIFELLKCMLDR
ncbi:hypothetical protein AGLY_010938 [Aphis glycines]|uniref:Uncharacterized protein n=1 Tax=Aphis glycines TaxID=307491 RepID=A0A6G0TC11_APHGL|nr:hypothetical protein AGLY_010938 [Aphis glycines]